MSTIQYILRKSALLLWLVLGWLFDWIESSVFHTDTWIGLTLGILLGSLIGYAVNRPKNST
jgi:hypothetical protein